jgi:hypothetical protein
MWKLVEGERLPYMELYAIERSRTEQTVITGECTAAVWGSWWRGRGNPTLSFMP